MFALLNFYMLLLVQTDPNNLTGRQLQSDFHFVLTISRSVSYAQHLKLTLYTTNFTEPLSYQGSAFLKLPKFP